MGFINVLYFMYTCFTGKADAIYLITGLLFYIITEIMDIKEKLKLK